MDTYGRSHWNLYNFNLREVLIFRANSHQCILPVFAMFANITTYEIILLTYLRLVMSRSVNVTVLSVVVNFSQSSAKSSHKQTQWILSQFYDLLSLAKRTVRRVSSDQMLN